MHCSRQVPANDSSHGVCLRSSRASQWFFWLILALFGHITQSYIGRGVRYKCSDPWLCRAFGNLGFGVKRLGWSYGPRRVDGSRSLTSHSLRSSSSVIGGMPHGHSTGIYCRGSIRMHQFQQRSVASSRLATSLPFGCVNDHQLPTRHNKWSHWSTLLHVMNRLVSRELRSEAKSAHVEAEEYSGQVSEGLVTQPVRPYS